jgi:hypothetical protein
MAQPALRALKARTLPYSLRFFNPIVLISWLMRNGKHFDGVQ